MFTLAIKTDNAAFGEDRLEKAAEVGRILRYLANALEGDWDGPSGNLYDYNGNTVGVFTLEA